MEFILYVDNFILNFIQTYIRCDLLDIVMPYITMLGDGGILWILLGVGCIFHPKSRKMGICILLSLLIGLIICNITLKPLVARTRPFTANNFTDLLITMPKDFSFPSGHTLASFEMACSVFLFNKKWGIPALITASLVAFSRLYLYVHYPSDVLFSIILGILIAITAKYIVEKIKWCKNI